MKVSMWGKWLNRPGCAAAASLTLALGGCAPSENAAAVMSATLATLSQSGRDICVDRTTRGEPLAIFRNMAAAPDPSRRGLTWHAPRPLSAQQDLPLQQIIGGEFKDRRTVLEQPGRQAPAPLPATEQRRLNVAATKLSFAESDQRAIAAQSAAAPKAHARWWVFNRLRRDCGPIYTLSHPVIVGDIAFVSAMAGHWGTTYAIERKDGKWRTTAQWSSWLY